MMRLSSENVANSHMVMGCGRFVEVKALVRWRWAKFGWATQ